MTETVDPTVGPDWSTAWLTSGWSDIGYSFLIGEDGRVYEGRGWGVVGAHTLHYNAVAYGFCVIGNYMDRAPDQAALGALQAVINCGVKKVSLEPYIFSS